MLADVLLSKLEAPLQVRGFHVAREILFALGFLLVVLLLSEPFLAQERPKAAMPFRLRMPTAGSAVQPETPASRQHLWTNQDSYPWLLFFVLQGLLYIACLVKLAEIRRQKVGSRIKLRLLENEDHLFDAGLYLGFVGTIVSFILSSVSAEAFVQPDGGVFLHVVRHHLRFHLQNLPSAPGAPETAAGSRSRSCEPAVAVTTNPACRQRAPSLASS